MTRTITEDNMGAENWELIRHLDQRDINKILREANGLEWAEDWDSASRELGEWLKEVAAQLK